MDHLDEMTRSAGAAMHVAALRPRVAAIATGGARNVAGTGSERGEDRVETLDRRLVAADHEAIAALQPPDAAAGADIDVMDASFLQRFGAADIVLVEAIAAVDDDVVRLQR